MNLNHTVLDPYGAVTLQATLSDGPPVPVHLISETQAREDYEDVVITTTQANVRLRTSGSNTSNDESETSVIIPISERPLQTPYPGVHLNPRYNIHFLGRNNDW